MAKRRDPKSPSKEDKTSRKIDAYLIGKKNKVHMRLTLKQIMKNTTKLTMFFYFLSYSRTQKKTTYKVVVKELGLMRGAYWSWQIPLEK